MSAVKRKIPASLLERRVRPRYEPEPDSDDLQEYDDSSSEAPSEEGVRSDESGSESDSGSESEESEMSGSEDEVCL
jgi:hypothetical protein